MNSSVSPRLNADLLDEKYAQWKDDPHSVEPTWSAFFEGFELGAAQLEQQLEAKKSAETGVRGDSPSPQPASAEAVAASRAVDRLSLELQSRLAAAFQRYESARNQVDQFSQKCKHGYSLNPEAEQTGRVYNRDGVPFDERPGPYKIGKS